MSAPVTKAPVPKVPISKMSLLELFKKRTRHPFRPRTSDIVTRIFENFKKHPTPGDSLVLGESDFQTHTLFVIGQQKPTADDLKKLKPGVRAVNGMLTADEHSAIMTFLKHIRELDLDNAFIVNFIDTYGADISMYSAERFQAYHISSIIREFLLIPVKTISVLLGEGGSGGALALQATDRRGMIEDALYATAAPESMAAIMFRDASKIDDALNILNPTAKEMKRLGVIDTIIPATKEVNDADGLAENIQAFIEKSINDLSRIKIRKLMKQRRTRSESFGLTATKSRLSELIKMFERPLKSYFQKPPRDIKTVKIGSINQMDEGMSEAIDNIPKDVDCIKCGEARKRGGEGDGCGKLIPLSEFLENHMVCPECGTGAIMGARGWIDCLTDKDSFFELYRNLTVGELLDSNDISQSYRTFLEKQKELTDFNESLVTAEARIFGHPAVMVISEFNFSGGSMGVVFGEKFKRAVEYAVEKKYPLVSLCCSGGARLYEGIMALMQMVKTINAVNLLKENGLPFISVLGNPSTGGAIASYASLGDVLIAEPGAMVIFAGPRVMTTSGFKVDEKYIRSDHLCDISGNIYDNLKYFHNIRGIHEVCARTNMKRTIVKYLELYYRLQPTED